MDGEGGYTDYKQTVTDLGFKWIDLPVKMIVSDYTSESGIDWTQTFVGVEYSLNSSGVSGKGLLGLDFFDDELTQEQFAYVAGQVFGVDSGVKDDPFKEDGSAPAASVDASKILGSWTDKNSSWGTTYTFNADGTGAMSYSETGENYPFSYTIDGEMVDLKYSDGDTDWFNVKPSGETLTIIDKFQQSTVFDRVVEEQADNSGENTEQESDPAPESGIDNPYGDDFLGTWIDEDGGSNEGFTLFDKHIIGRKDENEKMFAIIIAVVMALTLAACGGGNSGSNAPQQNTTSNPVESSSPETPAANNTPAPSEPVQEPVQQTASSEIAPATDGTLTISAADVAVVVNGTSVPMPYHLKALEAAGVPTDESRSEIELGAGDFFSANLYLDENEDYLLIPAYYNGGDSVVNITDAEAEEITMTTYADEPKDQGVSIFGISFGMPRSEVKALIGEPDYDGGDYCEWHIEVPEIAYEGTLSMYFTEDADDAGVS
ncbi:MAG: hypothetical protein IJ713_07765 [Oscillibacter sp.]|nr:hypothetical protein [Oscillibacter sp.]